jgi:hypothetical protein
MPCSVRTHHVEYATHPTADFRYKLILRSCYYTIVSNRSTPSPLYVTHQWFSSAGTRSCHAGIDPHQRHRQPCTADSFRVSSYFRARYQQHSPIDTRRPRTQQPTPVSGPRNTQSGRKHPSLGYLSSRLTSSELRSRHNAVDLQ